MRLVLLLLASRAACPGALSLSLADSASVPHRRNRRAWRFGVLESSVFPPGAIVAGTASDLTVGRLFPRK